MGENILLVWEKWFSYWKEVTFVYGDAFSLLGWGRPQCIFNLRGNKFTLLATLHYFVITWTKQTKTSTYSQVYGGHEFTWR